MSMRYTFPINLKLFDNGWLCIEVSSSVVKSVRVVLDRPVPLPRSTLSIFGVSYPSCLSAISFHKVFNASSNTYSNYVSFNNLKIYAKRGCYYSRFLYWYPIELCITYEDSDRGIFPIWDVFRILRPCVVRRLFFSKISIISLSCGEDSMMDNVLKCVKFRYEVPIVGKLPEMFLKNVPEYVSNNILIKCLEDYLLSIGDLSNCMRVLYKAGIVNRHGMLTKLGVVLCLILAPHVVDDSMLEVLRI